MKSDASILDLLTERLSREDVALPVFDRIGERVRALVADPDFELDALERLVHEDAALVSELLRMANSAFFRGLDKVTTVRDSVMRLGARQVGELVTLASQRATFRSQDAMVQGWLVKLWRHAVATSIGARWLAERCGFGDLANEAFLAGLLHDVGKLLVLRTVGDLRSEGLVAESLSHRLLLDVVHRFHTTEGEKLLRRFEMPDVYANVALRHHDDAFDPTDGVLVVVRTADVACHRLGLALEHDASIVLAATPEAQCLGASEVLLAQLEVLLEDAMQLAG